MTIFQHLAIFDRITFVEKTHSYLIDGETFSSPSVTRLLKRYKKKFEKDKLATKVAKKRGLTTQQVIAEWELNNLYSTTLGSMLHKYIENYYCNKRIEFEGNFEGLGFEEKKKIKDNLPILIKYFQNFYNQNKHLICVKNEMVVGDIDDTKVCGMLDMLAFNSETNQLEILDFKTNKKMDKTSPWGNLFYPFDDMTEGEINEYTIQLNCYKNIIEKYTPLKIDKMKLIWFNVNNKDYQIFELADIQPKIELMFKHYASTSLFEE